MGVVAPSSWKESSWASNQAWSSLEEAKRTEGVAEVEADEDRCMRFIPHHWSAKRGVGLKNENPPNLRHYEALRTKTLLENIRVFEIIFVNEKILIIKITLK